MAISLGWQGAVDTNLQFSTFFSNDHTVAIWVMPQYPNAYIGPVLTLNGTGMYMVGQGDRNAVPCAHCLLIKIEGQAFNIGLQLETRRWYYLAVVRSGSNMQVFLDGFPVGYPLALTNTLVPSGTLRLGRRAPDAIIDGQEAQFYGLLDNLAVYTRALPWNELRANFESKTQLTGSESGLLAGYRFSPAAVPMLPATLSGVANRSGQTELVAASSNRDGVDGDLIPLPLNSLMELPFLAGEAWYCAQGFAAEFSHRGYAAFCQDFVEADLPGDWNQQYPLSTNGAPIFSTGEGTVSMVVDSYPPYPAPLPANVPGSNLVYMRQADGLVRGYLHLKKGTSHPYEGQNAHTGQPIANICEDFPIDAHGNRAGPHLHFAVSNQETGWGFVTVPYAFSNYEVRNPDGSWTPVEIGIPAQGQVVRRTGSSLWVVEESASTYTLITPPSLSFKLVSQMSGPHHVWIDVSLDGVNFHTLISEDFLGAVPQVYLGDWNGRQAGANTRDKILLFWLGQTADGTDFFNVNGLYHFRLKAAGPNGQSSDPVTVSAEIRWHGQRITCIKVSGAGTAGQHITAVGGEDADRGVWQLTLVQAIHEIERGQSFHVEEPQGDRVQVVVAVSNQGRKYLKTTADGDLPNNLLSLSRCP